MLEACSNGVLISYDNRGAGSLEARQDLAKLGRHVARRGPPQAG